MEPDTQWTRLKESADHVAAMHSSEWLPRCAFNSPHLTALLLPTVIPPGSIGPAVLFLVDGALTVYF